jgi:hypothetical protein
MLFHITSTPFQHRPFEGRLQADSTTLPDDGDNALHLFFCLESNLSLFAMLQCRLDM